MFSKHWPFRLAFLALICLSATTIVQGCDQSSETKILQELDTVRRELRSVKQLAHDVSLVERQLSEMQNQLNKLSPDNGSTPIAERSYSPNGSERDDPFLGPKNAPVLVMAFSDFQCKPCQQFYERSLPLLKKEFVDNNLIKFVIRDFPLANHPQAVTAAALAHCAGEQGKYWEMFDLLFDNQELLKSGAIKEIQAKAKGTDSGKLQLCLESKRYHSEIDQDISDGLTLGAKGVPGFYVGYESGKNDGGKPNYRGVFIRGAQPYPVIRGEIRKMLDQATTRASPKSS